jgi:PGF-pre-PGF domain-containing protein
LNTTTSTSTTTIPTNTYTTTTSIYTTTILTNTITTSTSISTTTHTTTIYTTTIPTSTTIPTTTIQTNTITTTTPTTTTHTTTISATTTSVYSTTTVPQVSVAIVKYNATASNSMRFASIHIYIIGGYPPYSVVWYSGPSASCVSEPLLINMSAPTSSTVWFLNITPTTSAYYCARVLDSQGYQAYSNTVLVNPFPSNTAASTSTATTTIRTTTTSLITTSILTTTTIPSNTAAGAPGANGITTSTSNAVTTVAPVNVVTIAPATNATYPSSLGQLLTTGPVPTTPSSAIQNISATIGVPVQNVGSSIANAIGSPSSVSCVSCGNGAPQALNGIVAGFVANITVSNATFIKAAVARNAIPATALPNIANVVAQNPVILKQLVSNYTPSGFRQVQNSTSVTVQNSSTVNVKWVALANSTNSTVNISALQSMPPSTSAASSLPLSTRVVQPYMAGTFNSSSVVNRSITQQLHISDAITGSRAVAKYTPTNVTVYSAAKAAVISVTNVGGGASTQMRIPRTNMPIRNITLTTKANITASGVSVKAYPANATSVASIAVPKPPGTTLGYIYVNSTISDSQMSAVNYTFNVTQSWVRQNSVDPYSLAMFRYNTTTASWARLQTTLVSANSTSYVYMARSTGMSIYAISGSLNLTSANAAITINMTNAQNATNSTKLAQAAQQYSRLIQTLIVIVVAAAAIILVLFLRKPPMKPPEPVKESDAESLEHMVSEQPQQGEKSPYDPEQQGPESPPQGPITVV